jgi:dihydroorotase
VISVLSSGAGTCFFAPTLRESAGNGNNNGCFDCFDGLYSDGALPKSYIMSRIEHFAASSHHTTRAMQVPNELLLPAADDFHLHLRDGSVLQHLVTDAASQFARAVRVEFKSSSIIDPDNLIPFVFCFVQIVMPNLKPQPVFTTADAIAYRQRIMDAVPSGSAFHPLMTLYLTDHTSVDEIRRAKQSGVVFACKLYPAGATTNSHAGVTDISRLYPVFDAMAEAGMPLLVHGEVTDPSIDMFDRESVFIERHLRPLVHAQPQLKIVMEHITTSQAVEFVLSCDPKRVAATITAHHLLYNRNALFTSADGAALRPHAFCLPVLKRETHRQALLRAIASGSSQFFAGTDSAPHARHTKERDCGCAGVYTAHNALALYAEALESVGALHRLVNFCSGFGADFYGLPRNTAMIRLRRNRTDVPSTLPLGEHEVVPLRAGESVAWSAPEWLHESDPAVLAARAQHDLRQLPVCYRQATRADADCVARFAARTFFETFAHLYPPEELHIHLSDYNESIFGEWIENPSKYHMLVATVEAPSHEFSIAHSSDDAGSLVGYVLAGPCTLPHPDATETRGELKKLYVARSHFGTGVAAQLTERALQWLRTNFQQPLYIGVWSENYRAQTFYAKYGFSKCGEYGYKVGRCVDLEWILRNEMH